MLQHKVHVKSVRNLQSIEKDPSLECRQIIQVDALQDGGSCQFEPEALVSAIKYIVEEHMASWDDNTHAQGNGSLLPNSLHTDIQKAPPVGFHDL